MGRRRLIAAWAILTAACAAAQPTPPAATPGATPGATAGATAAAPSAPPVLRWLVQDMPPHFAYRDKRPPQRVEDLGDGEVDGFLRLLIERMPQYRHEFIELSLPRFTVVQPELNLLDRAQYEGPLQTLCIDEQLGVITYFSLASGYLSGKYRDAGDLGKSPRGASVKAYLEGKGPAMLAAMDRIAGETGATLSQIALAWVAAQPGVTAPIASATSVSQLDEILASETLVLTAGQLAALNDAGRG